MSALKIGGLCFGYGGLDIAVQAVIPGAELAWYAEFDKGASKIGTHRFPGIPNHGDMTAIDWAAVEPVDIITGGTPCQDLSHAGKRKGMTDGTRSNLWVAMREAIATIRPSLVVWENVGGAASAAADSEVEPCAGCVGDGSGVSLRALGRVVGDLSSLGYVGSVRAVRASDVGAPHGRLRYFLAAHPEGDTASLPPGQATESSGDLMLPSAVTLLPTPAVNDMGEGKTVEAWDAWTAKMKAAHGNGNGHGASLAIEAQRLLPTPTVEDRKASGSAGYGGNEFCTLTDATVRQRDRWGIYADAIARWERLTRPAPAPTQLSESYLKMRAKRLAGKDHRPVGRRGSLRPSPQLAPSFSEWMMGLPEGWVTDVPGITRNEALKALGNGVVWQQAAAALRLMLGGGSVPISRNEALLPTPRALDATGVRGVTPNRSDESNARAGATLSDFAAGTINRGAAS